MRCARTLLLLELWVFHCPPLCKFSPSTFRFTIPEKPGKRRSVLNQLLLLTLPLALANAETAPGISPALSKEYFTGKAIDTHISLFDSVPAALFAKESSPVIFQAQLAPNSAKTTPANAPKLALIQTTPEGKKLRYIGIMSDDGVMGDRVKNDGIYTRKLQMNEKQAGKLYYAVVEETEAGVPDQVDPSKLTNVEIIRRPSFVELISTIWGRVSTQLHHSN